MTSDREWEDFLMGNPNSPYPRVQMINRARAERENLGRVAKGGPVHGGGGGDGLGTLLAAPVVLAASPLIAVFWLTGWLHGHVSVFRWTDAASRRIGQPGRWTKIGLGVLGAFVAVVALAMLRDHLRGGQHPDFLEWLEHYGVGTALVLGAVVGVLVPSMIEGVIRLTTRSIVFAVVLPVVAAALAMLYIALATAFDWTPLHELLPMKEWFPPE